MSCFMMFIFFTANFLFLLPNLFYYVILCLHIITKIIRKVNTMQYTFKKEKTCCFTGHRLIPHTAHQKLQAALDETIEILIGRGYDTFVSGGALGFDMLAAETVLRLKNKYPHVRLVMALPCRNQQAKWKLAEQQRYNSILERADDCIFLSDGYYRGCMHVRNRYMVNNSSICIAYLTREDGGTAYTVRYAEECGVDTANLAYLII